MFALVPFALVHVVTLPFAGVPRRNPGRGSSQVRRLGWLEHTSSAVLALPVFGLAFAGLILGAGWVERRLRAEHVARQDRDLVPTTASINENVIAADSGPAR